MYRELYDNTDHENTFGNLFTDMVNVYSESSLTEMEAVAKHHEHIMSIIVVRQTGVS